MLARAHPLLDLEDYFEIELSSEWRFEYVDGQVRAMSGGKLAHNTMEANVVAALHRLAGGRCRVFGSNQRIATADGTHTYPDAMVVCGRPEVTRFRGTDTVHNPVLLVEVLSPSTREYDRTDKLARYQATPSVREVLLVDPDAWDVEQVVRQDGGWIRRRYRLPDDEVALVAFSGALRLRDLYQGVLGSGEGE